MALYVMFNIVNEHKENENTELTLCYLWIISAAR